MAKIFSRSEQLDEAPTYVGTNLLGARQPPVGGTYVGNLHVAGNITGASEIAAGEMATYQWPVAGRNYIRTRLCCTEILHAVVRPQDFRVPGHRCMQVFSMPKIAATARSIAMRRHGYVW